MKNTELRIGNYLGLTESARRDLWDCCEVSTISNVISVDWINKDEIGGNISAESFEFDFDNIEPIPLTEEWLVKFGYIKLKDTVYDNFILRIYSLYDSSVSVNCHNNGTIDFDYFVNYDCTVELKYVNQLQNLYFCLVGKELKIKEG